MSQINPDVDIENKQHRELIKHYWSQIANTPLKTAFHKIPLLEDYKDGLKYNLTNYLLDDLIYRYYSGSNITLFVWGPRADYKSTLILRLKIAMETAAKLKIDFNDIIDSDSKLLERARPVKETLNTFLEPPIKKKTGKNWRYVRKPGTFIVKDEWDTVISGLGNMTTSLTVKNYINRGRADQNSIAIACPEWKYYPVDYNLKVWEYRRLGNKIIRAFIFNEENELKGHIEIPMPSDEMIDKYQERKDFFLENNSNLDFNVDKALIQIAERTIIDSKAPIKEKMTKPVKTALAYYLGSKYPELQSIKMREAVIDMIIYMKDNDLLEFPKPN